MVYSPRSAQTEEIMSFFHLVFKRVDGLENAHALEDYFVTNTTNSTLVGIEFPDNYATHDIPKNISDLSITIR